MCTATAAIPAAAAERAFAMLVIVIAATCRTTAKSWQAGTTIVTTYDATPYVAATLTTAERSTTTAKVVAITVPGLVTVVANSRIGISAE